jgi:hypothetical protein
MTGILVRPQGDGDRLAEGLLSSLDFAVGRDLRDMVEIVQTLRGNPSLTRREVYRVWSLAPGEAQKADETEGSALEERLFNAVADAKTWTSKVAMHLDPEWRHRLFRQLDSLHDPKEWEEGDRPLQQASFVTFLKAMLTIDPERRPSLGLSHAGHLIAAWTTGPDRLTIEFLPNDHVRWVLSRCYAAEDTARFAGDSLVTRLVDGLAPHHPEHWFSHAHHAPL